jgi:hypothetical protein
MHALPRSHPRWRVRALGVALGWLVATAVQAAPLEFQLTLDPRTGPEPATGRVYVFLSATEPRGLPAGPRWFDPEPFCACQVKDWRPGQTIRLTAGMVSAFPVPLSAPAKGDCWLQAVLDRDRGVRSFSAAEGNVYSRPVRLGKTGARAATSLVLDQVYHEPAFKETPRVKLVDIPSRLLSAFHHRPARLRAGVVLPKSFATQPGRQYPVVYEIPGFGGNHFAAVRAAQRDASDVAGVEMLYVVLDPNCRWGHHVFADSENNGPCGRALIEELIPHIEKAFRGLGMPAARFVTGHSSGGWSSLWLQVAYPDFFGGVWSTAPDPVDFRDFQRINLYAPGVNMFVDEQGKPRPLARRGNKVAIWYRPFSDMEEVMGHGGQLGSFEAAFSQRGPDGRPARLWDRRTGRVDPAVARTWERYDIRLILEHNWPVLGPKLAGKIHVYMGEQDTFYLEGATRLLKETLARLGSDAVVELFPGRDHGTLLDRGLRQRIAQEMAEQYRRRWPPHR